MISFSCCSADPKLVYQSENLYIEEISEGVYRHISFIDIPNYGKFPCNGVAIVSQNESAIFDTPVYDYAGKELLAFLADGLNTTIKYVVPTHFHIDCLGSIDVFTHNGAKSISSELTEQLAMKDSRKAMDSTFNESLFLEIGDIETITKHHGQGHTKDNVVTYLPKHNILFGGCLIKELGAGKGNLDDANIEQWPKTVKQVKREYPEVKVVIPGHGKTGGAELLDYTIELFEGG
ncbi:MAG: BcII family subclass B1 metallo-beta-lactamase [Candidatus Kapaibacteriales bacterium]